jgi:hypothetical protein
MPWVMRCPQCGYMMTDFDKECPRCHGKGMPSAPQSQAPQKPIPPSTWTPNSPPQAPQPTVTASVVTAEPSSMATKIAGWGCLSSLFLCCVMPLGCVVIDSFSPAKWSESKAYVTAQLNVKNQLKSPTTASFPYSSAPGVVVNHVGDDAHIVSYVDAQNGFGATIRERWIATVHWNSSTDTYTVTSATLVE